MIQEVPDDFLLSDFGSSVTAGAVVGLGFKDEISNFVLDDRVISIDCALTVRTDLFGGLQYRDLVEHGGQTYRLLHEPLRQADGRFCVMLLEKVEPTPGAFTFLVTLNGLQITTLDNRPIRTL
jgi:hypothetical protein